MTDRPHHHSRRMRGFEAAASLMAPHIRRAAEGRGVGVARILTDWPEVVGPEVAAICRPVRITHGKGGFGGTLVLLCPGAQAPRLAMLLEAIRLQVNACYGFNAVARISVTQTAATGFAEAQAGFGPRPATPPQVGSQVGPAALARAEAAAAGIEDPALSASLHRLALLYHSRRDAHNKGS